MRDLERQCRRTLRWHPRRWRAEHEDALVGILLDQADAEGRIDMTSTDRRQLAAHGLRRRLAPVALRALLGLGLLAALQLGSMVVFRNGLDDQLLLSPPALHPVPTGTSWTPLFIVSASSGTVALVCILIVIAASTAAASALRTGSRARRTAARRG